MSQEVYSILYCSSNLIRGGADQVDAEISQILHTARRNNSRQSVTGALLFSSGYFAQMLEGPQPAIEAIFEKIQRDPRHGNVTVLKCGREQERTFPDWSMAHVQIPNGQKAEGVAATLNLAIVDPGAAQGEVMALLRSLVFQED